MGIMFAVFNNGLWDRGLILGWVIPKIQKCYMIPPCLTFSIIKHGSRVSGAIQRKWVAPFPTPQCRSYKKRNLQVTIDYGRSTYLTLSIYLSIYIYIYKLLFFIAFQFYIFFFTLVVISSENCFLHIFSLLHIIMYISPSDVGVSKFS